MKRRMNNIFRRNGKSVVLAMDHGNGMNVLPDLNNPGKIIEKAVAGGIDGILTTYGIATTYYKEIGNIGLILRADGGTTQLAKSDEQSMDIINQVETAISIGADSMLCMGFPGASNEAITLKGLARLINEASKWNLPIGAEMLPRGFEPAKDGRTPENLAFACRVGAELGADYIKTAYSGDVESFKKVIEGCYKPVLVLGGGDPKDERRLFQMVKDSMEAGAAGVIMGRNIWRYPNPDKISEAIVAIVHYDATVDEALEILKN